MAPPESKRDISVGGLVGPPVGTDHYFSSRFLCASDFLDANLYRGFCTLNCCVNWKNAHLQTTCGAQA